MLYNDSLQNAIFSHFHLTSFNFSRVRHSSAIPHGTKLLLEKSDKT